jgi:hypothetical protein
VQGYFFKAAVMETELLTIADTAEVVIQAQVAQTIGMRILFFFPVTVRNHLVLFRCVQHSCTFAVKSISVCRPAVRHNLQHVPLVYTRMPGYRFFDLIDADGRRWWLMITKLLMQIENIDLFRSVVLYVR